jgi:hypothetical protein
MKIIKRIINGIKDAFALRKRIYQAQKAVPGPRTWGR